MSDFISRNKPDWQELEALVARARKRTSRMNPDELARLDVLYRRATIHLAQAATRTNDHSLIEYLNGLTGAAHAVIYLPPPGAALWGVVDFFTQGFARAVARTWRFHAVAAALLIVGAVGAYYAASRDVAVAYALTIAGDPRTPGATPEQLREVLTSQREIGHEKKFLFASFLFANNMKVGLLALCLGILAGVPTIFLLLLNGMLLGAMTALYHRAGIYAEWWAWVLPHGVTELLAIVLAGGVGLILGRAVLSPGELTRNESLRRAGNEAVTICLGIGCMLIFAAIIESYLRQSQLSNEARLAFAGLTASAWILYFLHGAKREQLALRARAAGEPVSH